MTLSILIVSHTYCAPINLAKLEALSKYVKLTAIIPTNWQDALFALPSQTDHASGYGLHPLPIRFNGYILRYFFSVRSIDRLLQQVRPDAVYVEEEPASIALAQFAFLKRRYHYKLICFTWENIQRRVGLPGLERYNLDRCDGAIAGNTGAEQVLHSKNFRKPISITPQLGIDPDFFRPARSVELRRSIGLTGFAVGYVGRLVEEKGLLTLLAAIEQLPEIQLMLVGNGPLRAKIIEQIESHALNDRVHLLDPVSHSEIVSYLNVLDAFVLPSLTTATWKEQFGHVLIEAMACGVPVVGSNSGAIPEVIANAGIIVPEGHVDALRDAIKQLQSDPNRRQQLVQAGRERILAHYTHDQIATANVEFFQRIMNS